MEIIDLNGVNISFGGEPLVKNFNLQINSGEFVLFKGNNGSGKTSVIKALLGDLEFTGSIKIKGEPQSPNLDLFKTISYISSDVNKNFASGVVLDELLMPQIEQGIKRKIAKDRAEQMLNFFGATRLKKCNVSTLSGGEKQLVALISALLINAELIIIDEGLSAMDVGLKRQTFEKLKTYLREKRLALLFVTNEVDTFSESDFDKIINLTDSESFEFTPLYNSAENGTPLLTVNAFSGKIKKHVISEPVDFDLNSGDCLTILGESGNGKSLIANALAGFEKFSGSLTFGEGVTQGDVKIIFQEPENYLLKPTVKQELEKFDGNENCLSLLEQTGLNKKLDVPLPKLSAGEKRILALIEIILANPKILILDEFFANLSSKSLKVVCPILKTFTANGGGLIIVEHNEKNATVYSNKTVNIQKQNKNLYVEKSVSLGRYSGKNSPVHKMPALIKIAITIAYVVLAFLCREWWHFGAMFGFYLLSLILSLTNPFKLLKPTFPLWIFAIFILILNGLTINWIEGTKMFMRLSLINLFVPLLTLTTTPYELLTAFPIKLVPFKFLKRLVSNLELILITSLLSVENFKTMAINAMRWQKNVGVNYKGSKLKAKIKNLGEVLVLLFNNLILSSKETANVLYLKGANYRWYTK